MKKIFLVSILLLTGSLHAGRTSESRPPLPDVLKFLANTEGVEVFEGLPHQMFEQGVMEAEKKNKKVFAVGGEYFYEKKLPVTKSDKVGLSVAFSPYDFIEPYSGYKPCGGFHADYMVTWLRKDAPPTHALVCFGCGEIKFVLEGSVFHADLTSRGYESLKVILSKYHQERPRKANLGKLKPEPTPPPKIPIPIPELPPKP
jgi:hypothetical protein